MRFRHALGSAAAGFVMVASALASAQDAPPPPAPRMRQACMADVQRLCPDAQPGHGAVGRCLRGHASDVSPDCRSAMTAARVRREARRAAGQGSEPQPQTPPQTPPQRPSGPSR